MAMTAMRYRSLLLRVITSMEVVDGIIKVASFHCSVMQCTVVINFFLIVFCHYYLFVFQYVFSYISRFSVFVCFSSLIGFSAFPVPKVTIDFLQDPGCHFLISFLALLFLI